MARGLQQLVQCSLRLGQGGGGGAQTAHPPSNVPAKVPVPAHCPAAAEAEEAEELAAATRLAAATLCCARHGRLVGGGPGAAALALHDLDTSRALAHAGMLPWEAAAAAGVGEGKGEGEGEGGEEEDEELLIFGCDGEGEGAQAGPRWSASASLATRSSPASAGSSYHGLMFDVEARGTTVRLEGVSFSHSQQPVNWELWTCDGSHADSQDDEARWTRRSVGLASSSELHEAVLEPPLEVAAGCLAGVYLSGLDGSSCIQFSQQEGGETAADDAVVVRQGAAVDASRWDGSKVGRGTYY